MVVDAFKAVGLVIELREAMAGAVDDAKDLREGDHEVEDLRQEEQQHCLCEMTKNANHSESHACEVAESVTDEDL